MVNILMRQKKSFPVRSWEINLKLHTGEKVDMDFVTGSAAQLRLQYVDYVYEPGNMPCAAASSMSFPFFRMSFRIDFFGDGGASVRLRWRASFPKRRGYRHCPDLSRTWSRAAMAALLTFVFSGPGHLAGDALPPAAA